MVNSRKNKADGEPEVHNEDDEITDVLLMGKDEAPKPKTEKIDDVIYELVVEDKNTRTNETTTTKVAESSFKEQIKQLQQTQEAMRLQLKETFLTTEKLTRKLQKERRTKRASVTSYVALTMGGLALIIAVAVALFLGKLQGDVKSLTISIVAVEKHKHIASKTIPLGAEAINARIDELSTKFELLLAGQSNMDEALQATMALKTQLNKLANEHLSTSKTEKMVIKKSIKPKQITSTDKPTKVALSTKATSKKTSTEKIVAKKTEKKPALSTIKRGKDGSILNASLKTALSTESESTTKNWVVGLGSYKNATTAEKKASLYRKSGVPAIVVKVNAQGQIRYRVSTKSFSTKEDATTYAKQVKQKLNIKSTLVTNH